MTFYNLNKSLKEPHLQRAEAPLSLPERAGILIESSVWRRTSDQPRRLLSNPLIPGDKTIKREVQRGTARTGSTGARVGPLLRTVAPQPSHAQRPCLLLVAILIAVTRGHSLYSISSPKCVEISSWAISPSLPHLYAIPEIRAPCKF